MGSAVSKTVGINKDPFFAVSQSLVGVRALGGLVLSTLLVCCAGLPVIEKKHLTN